MNTVTREHLAGLELALEATHNHPIIADLIAQASAAPEQESVAWACRQQLQALKKAPGSATCAVWNASGFSRIPLYTHADPSDVEQLKQNHRAHAARLIDERGRLREQLAKAQAMLREVQPVVLGTQGAEDYELSGRIDAFLSAPAQPAEVKS